MVVFHCICTTRVQSAADILTLKLGGFIYMITIQSSIDM